MGSFLFKAFVAILIVAVIAVSIYLGYYFYTKNKALAVCTNTTFDYLTIDPLTPIESVKATAIDKPVVFTGSLVSVAKPEYKAEFKTDGNLNIYRTTIVKTIAPDAVAQSKIKNDAYAVFDYNGSLYFVNKPNCGDKVTIDNEPKYAVYRSSSTNGPCTLVMQGDANLVIYDNSGKPLWATATNV